MRPKRGSSLGWPVVLREGPVGLRPLSIRDQQVWTKIRARSEEWLKPWEATPPPPTPSFPMSFRQMVRQNAERARADESLPWALTYHGHLAGQVNVSGIVWGSSRSATIGYWIDVHHAGRGIMPTAVAMATDFCFFTAGLHRVEVNIRPENQASLRVVDKLGFREEGIKPKLLHIDGAWRDHRSFALTVEDVPDGLLQRWRSYRMA